MLTTLKSVPCLRFWEQGQAQGLMQHGGCGCWMPSSAQQLTHGS
jgi:hypothetical protein